MVQAKEYQSKLLSVTYLFEYAGITLAFFSVSNDRISAAANNLSNRQFKRLFQQEMPQGKQYRSYPAVKIGRLGVHASNQSGGFGSQLLDYIKGMFISNNRTGCQYITVDAYNNRRTLDYYERNGFFYFSEEDKNDDTRQMYFKLLDLV